MQIAIGVLVLLVGPFASAQTLDKASQEAMEKTQQLLNSPSDRGAFISKDANAKSADASLKAVPGLKAEDQQKAYEISGQVMNTMVQKTGGDVGKQQEMMQQAMRDPQAFFNSLPADQRRAIEQLAGKAESQTAPAAH